MMDLSEVTARVYRASDEEHRGVVRHYIVEVHQPDRAEADAYMKFHYPPAGENFTSDYYQCEPVHVGTYIGYHLYRIQEHENV